MKSSIRFAAHFAPRACRLIDARGVHGPADAQTTPNPPPLPLAVEETGGRGSTPRDSNGGGSSVIKARVLARRSLPRSGLHPHPIQLRARAGLGRLGGASRRRRTDWRSSAKPQPARFRFSATWSLCALCALPPAFIREKRRQPAKYTGRAIYAPCTCRRSPPGWSVKSQWVSTRGGVYA